MAFTLPAIRVLLFVAVFLLIHHDDGVNGVYWGRIFQKSLQHRSPMDKTFLEFYKMIASKKQMKDEWHLANRIAPKEIDNLLLQSDFRMLRTKDLFQSFNKIDVDSIFYKDLKQLGFEEKFRELNKKNLEGGLDDIEKIKSSPMKDEAEDINLVKDFIERFHHSYANAFIGYGKTDPVDDFHMDPMLLREVDSKDKVSEKDITKDSKELMKDLNVQPEKTKEGGIVSSEQQTGDPGNSGGGGNDSNGGDGGGGGDNPLAESFKRLTRPNFDNKAYNAFYNKMAAKLNLESGTWHRAHRMCYNYIKGILDTGNLDKIKELFEDLSKIDEDSHFIKKLKEAGLYEEYVELNKKFVTEAKEILKKLVENPNMDKTELDKLTNGFRKIMFLLPANVVPGDGRTNQSIRTCIDPLTKFEISPGHKITEADLTSDSVLRKQKYGQEYRKTEDGSILSSEANLKITKKD